MDKVILGLQQVLQAEILVQFTADLGPLKDIKKVYFGDPIKIPESDLPAIALQPVNSQYTLRGSRYDQKKHSIEVRLINNKKLFFKSIPPDQTTVSIVKDTVEKAETTLFSFETSSKSICGTIQDNTCLFYDDGGGPKMVANLVKVTGVAYLFKEDRAFPTYEVVITVEADVVGDR